MAYAVTKIKIKYKKFMFRACSHSLPHGIYIYNHCMKKETWMFQIVDFVFLQYSDITSINIKQLISM